MNPIDAKDDGHADTHSLYTLRFHSKSTYPNMTLGRKYTLNGVHQILSEMDLYLQKKHADTIASWMNFQPTKWHTIDEASNGAAKFKLKFTRDRTTKMNIPMQ